MKKKVLLIENQSTQFNIYFDKLSRHYDVYPKKGGNYEEVTDAVRIYLSKLYPTESWEKAQSVLENLVKTNQPDIYIIDYKLTGNNDGYKGDRLANDLRNLQSKIYTVPVLFLSAYPRNDKEVLGQLDDVAGNRDWIEKGYHGSMIENEEYFDSRVKKAINELLGESEEEKQQNKIEKIKKLAVYERLLKASIEKIETDYIEAGKFRPESIAFLDIAQNPDLNDSQLEKLTENFLKNWNP